MAMIEVNSLTKRYNFGRVRGIDNMSFSVNEGELFGFIGPNGAGKSTTIRILMNMLRPDSGTARIGGFNCNVRSRDIKRFTGYMPSDISYYPTVRVCEHLDYACRLRGEKPGIWRDAAAYFRLDPSKQFRELSMGNRRKLAFIQASMFSPKLLILDEPTGGLDPLMQERFFSALTQAQRNGTTVFFSSHNLGEVQRYCDRVALVKDGRIEMIPDIASLPGHIVEFVTSADCTALLEAVNATETHRDGNRISFMISGESLRKLPEMLCGMDIADLTVTRPSLEQTFHKIYGSEDND